MHWAALAMHGNRPTSFYCAQCSRCTEITMWRNASEQTFPPGSIPKDGELVYPDHRITALPDEAMPEDVKKDYEEAASIFSRSPRGAAALLRLGLQKLCKHLGEEGKNINDDIRSLA